MELCGNRGRPEQGSANRPITAARSGYVQSVDGDALMDLATEHTHRVQIAVAPGAFGNIVVDLSMTVTSHDRVNEDLAAALADVIVIGDERTPGQDLAFSIRRIVEIAPARAIARHFNDPTTALYRIHRLGEAFSQRRRARDPFGRALR